VSRDAKKQYPQGGKAPKADTKPRETAADRGPHLCVIFSDPTGEDQQIDPIEGSQDMIIAGSVTDEEAKKQKHRTCIAPAPVGSFRCS
jgi:hypothetical protein